MKVLHDIGLAFAHWTIITAVFLGVVAVIAWWDNRPPRRRKA